MNKYLVKLAEIAEDYSPSWSDTARSVISPAWGRRSVAQKHGFKDGGTWSEAVGTHIVGGLKAGVRSTAEGVGGALLGAGISRLTHGRVKDHNGEYYPAHLQALIHANSVPASALGAVGSIHGGLASLRNSLRDSDQEFAAKAALLKAQQSEKG